MADKLEREAEAIATEIDKGLKEQDGHLVKHQKTKQDLL